jgi:hypothetical protein
LYREVEELPAKVERGERVKGAGKMGPVKMGPGKMGPE